MLMLLEKLTTIKRTKTMLFLNKQGDMLMEKRPITVNSQSDSEQKSLMKYLMTVGLLVMIFVLLFVLVTNAVLSLTRGTSFVDANLVSTIFDVALFLLILVIYRKG